VLTLVALPVQPLLSATIARLAAEYNAVERARTLATWDEVEEWHAAIVMRVPTAQRPAFKALVREVRDA
jgi:hypothetical protein